MLLSPQIRIILILGRECLRLRKKFLNATMGTVEYSQTSLDLHTAWTIFKFAYVQYFGTYPRWQLRFY